VLQGRQIRVRLGSWRRGLPLGDLLAGGLLAGIGALTIVLAVNGPDMPTTGWRVTLSADLQHWASIATRHLSWLPGWSVAAAGLLVLVLLARRARRTEHPSPPAATLLSKAPSDQPPTTVPDTVSGCCDTMTGLDPVPMMESADGR
jgi:hypothetical protein